MNATPGFPHSIGGPDIPVIAEIGFNHEGRMGEAKAMIAAAAKAGAAAVKFQTFKAGDIALPSSPHFSLIKEGELDLSQHRELAACAKENGIPFLSTPFSEHAVDLLEDVGVAAYKIASMDVNNPLLLRRAARTNKPVILSTGMASLAEIAAAVELLGRQGAPTVALLHCLSLYPAKAKDLHLSVIPFLRQTFGLPTGYSDHYPGTKACLAAAMLGAELIETHFTLDSGREGGDHAHSVDPAGLAGLIADIRLFRDMRGQGQAAFFAERPDQAHAALFRRGLHAARDLAPGEVLRREDVLLCRPATDLSPAEAELVFGRPARQAVKRYFPLTRSDI